MPLREEIAAMELARDLGLEDSNHDATNRLNMRPKFTVNFASKEPRIFEPKLPDGPGPQAYDTTPSWQKPGVAKMTAPVGNPKIKHEELRPGPGTYSIPGAIAPRKPNRRNIMISSSPRTGGDKPVDQNQPGPGYYNLQKSLIRPSYNVYLSNAY